VVGVAVVVVASACSAHPKGTVASHLIFGGPPECRTRITCLTGLQQTYGLRFKAFATLDELGPVSIAALSTGKVQVVRLDSSDPNVPDHHWVILQDDKSFQQAGNIIPAIRESKATDVVRSLLDHVSATMTQGDLFALDTAVQVEHQAPEAAARNYVATKHLLADSAPNGPTEPITVGSASFSESEILAYIYGDVLAAAGQAVTVQVDRGSREKYEPELESGQIDLVPEYVGNYLSFQDPSTSNLSLSSSVSKLRSLLAPKGVTVLDPSSATDADAIVVTQGTSNRYHLTKISDLGKPVSG
jgi:glycine betaine/choline ABC-type transport system substrate-binding protein